MSYVSWPNSTTYPNAIQNTQLRNLKKLPIVKPPAHKMAAFYHLSDPNTNPTRGTHHEGP